VPVASRVKPAAPAGVRMKAKDQLSLATGATKPVAPPILSTASTHLGSRSAVALATETQKGSLV
jgi:hypothetical protein